VVAHDVALRPRVPPIYTSSHEDDEGSNARNDWERASMPTEQVFGDRIADQ
jgi:hypothetical protein